MYSVKLDKFEGPLDVLLELIDKEKLQIAEISLAQVTDQYLEYFKKLPQADLSLIADFLVVASQLILIKSKMLLPQLELSPDEEQGIEELQRRLQELQVIKQGALLLKKQEKRGRTSYGFETSIKFLGAFSPPKGVNALNLKEALSAILRESAVLEKLKQETIQVVVSFENKITNLRDRFQKTIKNTFSRIVTDAKSKVEVVVTFLALLELIRQRIVRVEQSDQFSEIHIHTLKNKN